MPNYLFWKKKVIHFRKFFEKCIFFLAKLTTLNLKKKQLLIYR